MPHARLRREGTQVINKTQRNAKISTKHACLVWSRPDLLDSRLKTSHESSDSISFRGLQSICASWKSASRSASLISRGSSSFQQTKKNKACRSRRQFYLVARAEMVAWLWLLRSHLRPTKMGEVDGDIYSHKLCGKHHRLIFQRHRGNLRPPLVFLFNWAHLQSLDCLTYWHLQPHVLQSDWGTRW